MLKFIPPKQNNLSRYASYGAGILKAHPSIGAAKNSLRQRVVSWHRLDGEAYRKRVWGHSFILENIEGEYFVLYEIPEGTEEADLPWMREFIHTEWGINPYGDYHKNSSYYQQKLASGEAKIIKKSRPMTTDEYVDWRLAVERERLGFGLTSKLP